MTARPVTILLVVAWGLLTASAQAQSDPNVALTATDPCLPGECVATVEYDPTDDRTPVVVEIDWRHPPDGPFTAGASVRCSPARYPYRGTGPCTVSSPVYDQAGVFTVAVRVTDAAGRQNTTEQDLAVESPPEDLLPGEDLLPEDDLPDDELLSEADLEDGCGPPMAGERCGPGNGRQTAVGDGKVSQKGWPPITGIFWQVTSRGREAHARTGTGLNDELLGHHGSDTLDGGDGKDVLWGDYDPKHNNTRQRDRLVGGAGDDFIYPSHGVTRVDGGAGRDYVRADRGRGVIDCGPGRDQVRIRPHSAFKLRNCEVKRRSRST